MCAFILKQCSHILFICFLSQSSLPLQYFHRLKVMSRYDGYKRVGIGITPLHEPNKTYTYTCGSFKILLRKSHNYGLFSLVSVFLNLPPLNAHIDYKMYYMVLQLNVFTDLFTWYELTCTVCRINHPINLRQDCLCKAM